MPEITVSMTPAYYDDRSSVLRMMLHHLSVQTCKDFDVVMVDHHYEKRVALVKDLAEHFKLTIHHMPYIPCTTVAKRIDCSVFNVGYLMSTAPRNVRYSCYRFVTPDFIETCMTAPKDVNMEFYSHNIGPDLIEEETRRELPDDSMEEIYRKRAIVYTRHLEIWDPSWGTNEVCWDKIPEFGSSPINSLQRWGEGPDTPIDLAQPNFYGNIMWWRNLWFDLNGVNEVITNFWHWEDIEFGMRAKVAKQKAMRRSHKMFRLFHMHGGHGQYSDTPLAHPLKDYCDTCRDCHMAQPRRSEEYCKRWSARVGIDVRVEECKGMYYFICENCRLVIPKIVLESDYTTWIIADKITRAPINIGGIGRNLQVLAEDLDKQENWNDKIELLNSSWSKARYHVRGKEDY